MGDFMYPAVFFPRPPRATTTEDVWDFLYKFFKQELDEAGDDIRVVINKHPSSEDCRSVKVYGIHLPFVQIRERIRQKKLTGSIVFDITPDFGLPRKLDGGLSPSDMILENKLACARSSLAINIMTDKVFRQLGNNHKFGTEVCFLGDFHKGRLGDFGHCSHYRRRNRLPESWKSSIAGSITEIAHRTAIEAIDRICCSNHNMQFFKDPEQSRFCYFSQCSIQWKHFIGVDADNEPTQLDVSGLMEKYGYIPFGSVTNRLIDRNALGGLRGRCMKCNHKFSLIGFDPDLHWLAGRCMCDYYSRCKSAITFKGENFTRLRYSRYFETILAKRPNGMSWQQCATNVPFERDHLLIVTPPLEAIYESVNHFKESAMLNFLLDSAVSRQAFTNKNVSWGTLVYSSYIETIVKSSRKVESDRTVVKFIVPKTQTWCEAGSFKIQRVNVYREKRGWIAKMHEIAGPQMLVHEEFDLNFADCFKGDLVRIEDREDEAQVVAVLRSRKGESFPIGQTYCIKPKKSKLEEETCMAVVNKWDKFVLRRSQDDDHKLSFLLLSVGEPHEYVCPSFQTGAVKLEEIVVGVTANPKLCRSLATLDDRFVGLELDLFKRVLMGGKKPCCVPGRVTRAVFQNHSPQILITAMIECGQNLVMSIGQEYKMCIWILYEPPTCVKEARIGGDSDSDVDENGNATEEAELLIEQSPPLDGQEVFYDEFNDHGNFAALEKDESQFDNQLEIERYPFFEGFIPRDYDSRIFLDVSTHAAVAKSWIRRSLTWDFSILDFMLSTKTKGVSHALCQTTRVDSSVPSDLEELSTLRQKIALLLNESQNLGLQIAIDSRLSVVQGPPGTGKTNLCGYGAVYFARAEKGLVVVVSPSNFAADNCFAKLNEVNERLGTNINIVRMLSMSRESQTLGISGKYLHRLVRRSRLYSGNEQQKIITSKVRNKGREFLLISDREYLRALTRRVERIHLNNINIIVATVGCATDSRLFGWNKLRRSQGLASIGTVIVDESSKVTLPGMINVLSLAPHRVWLLGDHSQLSPVIHESSAINAGLDIGWPQFMRLTRFFQEGNMFVMLKEQYRMQPMISDITSSMMYEGQLVTHSSLMKRRHPLHDQIKDQIPIFDKTPFILYDTGSPKDGSGGFEKQSGTSLMNVKEVEYTFDVIRKLLSAGVDPTSITTISMYLHQSLEMESYCKQYFRHLADKLTFATVDSYQGKENDVVIVSMVRSNGNGVIGYLRDIRRCNVAISRGRYLVLLVADFGTLALDDSGFFPRFLQVCKQFGVRPVTEL